MRFAVHAAFGTLTVITWRLNLVRGATVIRRLLSLLPGRRRPRAQAGSLVQAPAPSQARRPVGASGGSSGQPGTHRRRTKRPGGSPAGQAWIRNTGEGSSRGGGRGADVAARRRGQAPLIRPGQAGYGGPANGHAGRDGRDGGIGEVEPPAAAPRTRRRQSAPD